MRKLAVLCILYSNASAGCWWTTQFPDMRRQLAAFPIPESYALQTERQEGFGPTFYGRPPSVKREYLSSLDPRATCDELIAMFKERSPSIYRTETTCTLGFRIGAGWRGRLSGVWGYNAYVGVGPIPEGAGWGDSADPQRPRSWIGVSVRQE